MRHRKLSIVIPLLLPMLPLAVLADGDLVKPNVIFFLADDHQAGLVGAMGHEQIQTPHLDQLSERGMTFTNAHAEIASCSPSRAESARL